MSFYITDEKGDDYRLKRVLTEEEWNEIERKRKKKEEKDKLKRLKYMEIDPYGEEKW